MWPTVAPSSGAISEKFGGRAGDRGAPKTDPREGFEPRGAAWRGELLKARRKEKRIPYSEYPCLNLGASELAETG